VTEKMKRMRLFSWPVLALGLVAFVPLGRAQEVMQLSLKRAVDIALTPEGSARVALAEQSVRVQETHLGAARAAFFPNVDGSVNERTQTVNLHTFGFNFDFPGFAIPSIVGPFSIFDARASAQVAVLDFTTIRNIGHPAPACRRPRRIWLWPRTRSASRWRVPI